MHRVTQLANHIGPSRTAASDHPMGASYEIGIKAPEATKKLVGEGAASRAGRRVPDRVALRMGRRYPEPPDCADPGYSRPGSKPVPPSSLSTPRPRLQSIRARSRFPFARRRPLRSFPDERRRGMMRPLADHGRYPHAPWQSRHAGGGCGFSVSAVLCSTLSTRTAWGLKRWRLDAAPFFRLACHASSRPATNAHTPAHRARCIALMHSLTRACPLAPGAPRCTRQQADTARLASGHCLFPREN